MDRSGVKGYPHLLLHYHSSARMPWRHIQGIGSLEDVCAFCLEPRLLNIHNLPHGIQNGEAENARRCPYSSRGSAFGIYGDPFWSWWMCALPDSQQERSDAEDGRAYPQVRALIKGRKVVRECKKDNTDSASSKWFNFRWDCQHIGSLPVWCKK